MRTSLRASSPIWSREASLARTRERAAKPRALRSHVLARLASLAQIGELARGLDENKMHRLSEELKELCHEIYQHSNSKKCHQIVRNTKITIHSPFKPSNL